MRGKLALDLRHVDKCPVSGKLARQQPVRWVRGIVLPESAAGGIARLVEAATESIAQHLITSFSGFLRPRCRGDSSLADNAE
ncbi:hypothetical protein [Bradyrhizobium sp. CCBAU 051011]|uniref:hypothetical protein n=1 Tax=Bradyrhizobium sp. CCBAU 051011 TaxID=858422 RepID=UPI001FED3C52|nr:hypothetical protein [Bradyrhizobium sp. CCBAU 051011]